MFLTAVVIAGMLAYVPTRVSATPAPEAPQTCYLVGYVSHEGWPNYVEVPCSTTTATHLSTGWMDVVDWQHCWEGAYYQPEGTCDNNSNYLGEFYTLAEQQAHYEGGFYDVWDTPIIIPLGSARLKLTSPAEGVDFDHDADGVMERTAWTMAGAEVAFLAYDANGDGRITSGKELFGNHTVPGKANGFDALLHLGGVIKGKLSAADAFFNRLLLWTDRNHNGVSDPGELRPFGDLFYEIRLGYNGHGRRDGEGNLYRWRGWVTAKGNKPLRDLTLAERRAHHRFIYDVVLAVER